MTRLFTSGLESGSFATEGLTASGATIATDRPRVGTRSLKSSDADQYASRLFTGVSGRSYYARAYTNLDTLPAVSTVQGIFEWEAGGAWANLAVQNNGSLLLEHSGGSVGSTAAGVIAPDTWYRVEMRLKVNTAADDEMEVRLNGTTVLSTTTANYATAVIDELQFGNHNSGQAVTWYDDLAINDDQGASDNSWPGDPTTTITAVGGVATFGGGAASYSSSFVTRTLLVREKPPLRLAWDLETLSKKHYRWGEDELHPDLVPLGTRFSTTVPGGFESADVTLPRKPAADYADLEPFSTLVVYGAGGEVAGEYRLERAPRTSGSQMAITPSAVGWQAHLEDDKSAMEVYRDIDLRHWGDPSPTRVVVLSSAGQNYAVVNHSVEDGPDGPRISQAITGLRSSKPIVESTYRSPVPLGRLYDSRTIIQGGFTADAFYEVYNYLGNDTEYSSYDVTAELAPSTPGVATLDATTNTRKVAIMAWWYSVAGDWTQTYGLHRTPVVYGNHDLTIRGTEPDAGFYASDIVGHAVSTWAPLLNTDIQESQYVIRHAAYLDPTTAAEIIRDVTKYGLQDWGVWEDKTFRWANRGEHGRNWRARIGPTQLQETGPQVDRIHESVIVQYQDVDGTTLTVGPPDSGADTEDASLVDTDTENPAVRAGITRRALLSMGVAKSDDAIEAGSRYLELQLQLDTSGQASLVGYVEDEHGVTHPAWKVRAGDTISFVDAADTGPRRIVRTDYSHESRTCSIDLDSPPESLQALLERWNADLIQVAL